MDLDRNDCFLVYEDPRVNLFLDLSKNNYKILS